MSRAGLYCSMMLALLVGCHAPEGSAPAISQPAVAYQNSTIDALLDGNFDGEVSFAEVARHGDFGLGTVNSLDGELIVLGGKFFQVRSDGKAYQVSADAITPLAIVTFFRADAVRKIGEGDYPSLQRQLDEMRPGYGHAFAFSIHGQFESVKTRSVPRQNKPYVSLAEVVKTQPTFDLKNVTGTLVGFWYPESMRHVNVPGYHFHFITDDRTAGGHVLDLSITRGEASMQELATVEIALPTLPPATRPTTQASRELEKVEK